MARALIREMTGMRSWPGTRVHASVCKKAMLRYYYGVEEHKSLRSDWRLFGLSLQSGWEEKWFDRK